MRHAADRHARNILLGLSAVLLVATLTSGYLHWRSARAQHEELALMMGRSFFRTLAATRRWNARAGGIYAQVSADIVPNDYLDDPLRDLVTREGVRLTKLHPAYMTMLIARLLRHDEGIHVRITSLDPMNPENEPDEWERTALEEFEAGATEEFAVCGPGDDPLFRYIAPMMAEESCLTCHASQGYELGDVRGGISLAFAYQPFREAAGRHVRQIVALHVSFFLVGMFIIFFLGGKLVKKVGQLQESFMQIRTLEGILPICSSCKKIRLKEGNSHDENSWVPIESYIQERTEADFSHGLCPICRKALYPDLDPQGRGGKP